MAKQFNWDFDRINEKISLKTNSNSCEEVQFIDIGIAPSPLDKTDCQFNVYETSTCPLCVKTGDALDPHAIDESVRGQDAVLMSLGRSEHRQPTALFSDATRILIHAMEKRGVDRFLAIAGIGAGDNKGHGGFLYDWIFLPLFLRKTYNDKDRQETLIRESSLDWIIVRPAAFTNGPLRNNLRVAISLDGVTIRWISRADTASFSLDQLIDNRYLHKALLIGC